MLKKQLNEALSLLDELIAQTAQDIENIMQAKHSAVEPSVKKKMELVRDFEATKKALDKELVAVSKQNNGANLAEILDDEVKEKLVSMRQKLETLHLKNKEYARHVVLVKEFYDSLAKRVFGEQPSGYDSAANLKARV